MFKVVDKYGFTQWAEPMGLLEACQLRRDLYEQDRRDGTFEPNYYQVVRVEE